MFSGGNRVFGWKVGGLVWYLAGFGAVDGLRYFIVALPEPSI